MEALLDILSEIRPDVDFENQQDLVDARVLDSLDIVTLVAAIEEQMGVVVPFDEITPENFDSAQAMYALIERLR